MRTQHAGRGILWKRLAVGLAAATARSTDSGVCLPQMEDGRDGACVY